MKPLYFSSLFASLFLLVFASAAYAAGSMLRVTCEGEDVGAEVSVNGKFKGECPIDMKVGEGVLQLKVVKGDREFAKDVRLGEGVVQKIDAILTLTEEGKRKQKANGPVMVRIPGYNYEIGKYEVTQEQWQDVMGYNPSKYKYCGATCPVETVTWDEIHSFIQKLNNKTGKNYRLPSEDEWLFACYGGSQTEYCGSNDIDSVAWYSDNSNGSTHPVGQKKPNGYGVYDMSGNVTEWLETCWYYLFDSGDHKEGSPDCDSRMFHSGNYDGKPERVRAEFRNRFKTSVEGGSLLGFRLARTIP